MLDLVLEVSVFLCDGHFCGPLEHIRAAQALGPYVRARYVPALGNENRAYTNDVIMP